jgi:hypothetical protein
MLTHRAAARDRPARAAPICTKAASSDKPTGPNQRGGRCIATGQHEQAAGSPGEAEHESRGEKLAQRQRAGDDAQTRNPGGSAPAVAVQHQQGDDIGQPRLDAGYRQRNRRLGQGQADGGGGQTGDAPILAPAFSSIVERVIAGGGIFHADPVGQAHGLRRRRNPALSHAQLAWAGVGSDTHATVANFDAAEPSGPRLRSAVQAQAGGPGRLRHRPG